MNGPITKTETHLQCKVFCDDCGAYIKTMKHKLADVARTAMESKLAGCRWWCGNCWGKHETQ